MEVNEFVRLFPLRAKKLAWFFGAGTSASAGIPTAYDMIWDFKRSLFTSKFNYDIRQYGNLSDSINRNRIQAFCDSQEGFPKLNSPEEYSFYFEQYLKNERDRAAYVSEKVAGVSPSYGHRVLAGLMEMGLTKYVVTTNFDKAVENAVVQLVQNVESLYIASVENNQSIGEHLNRGTLPLLVKIHGDYHSIKLKNTKNELKVQDYELRKAFEQMCTVNGLAVIGYSGRDEAVMDILSKLAENQDAFPNGLFWFHKSDYPILSAVTDLIEKATASGIDAHLIESETFDEVFGALFKGLSDVPEPLRQKVDVFRDRTPRQVIQSSGKRFPVIRLNGLPIIDFPSSARLIDCEIGGSKEMQKAISDANADLIAIRKKEGVIGYGADSEFDRVFEGSSIRARSIYTIPTWQLKYEENAFKDLFLKCIVRGILSDESLKYTKRHSSHVIHINPKSILSPRLGQLTSLSYNSYGKVTKHEVTGIVNNTDLRWVDAVELSLNLLQNSLFLVLQPTVIAQRTKDVEMAHTSGAFVKEKIAQRLNEGYNEILSAWIHTLFPTTEGSSEAIISAFNIKNGVDAKFKIGLKTVYSKS